VPLSSLSPARATRASMVSLPVIRRNTQQGDCPPAAYYTSFTARMNGSSASMCWRGVVKPGGCSPINAAPVFIARIEKWVAPSAFQVSAALRQRSGPSA